MEVKIIEVEMDAIVNHINGKDVKRGDYFMYVKSDWHCPIMVENELLETEGMGNIFQNMPTPRCGRFDKKGVLLFEDEDDVCEYYKGHFVFHLIDEDESGFPARRYVKCSNVKSVNLDKLDLHLYRTKEIFNRRNV